MLGAHPQGEPVPAGFLASKRSLFSMWFIRDHVRAMS